MDRTGTQPTANSSSPRYLLCVPRRRRHAIVRGQPRVPAATFPDIGECQDLVADHKELIEPLLTFFTERGRLPVGGEIPTASQLSQLFGSVPRAFSLVRRVTATDRWDSIRQARRADVLVYLALAAFPTRPRFGALPEELQHDIRAFFGSYKSGCTEADVLLFSAGNQDAVDRACRSATVGKLLPSALYVHHTALPHLPPVLRVYEACARQLAGTVDGLTLVKLFRRRACVAYLSYEDFDRIAHPALQHTIIADLKRLDLQFRDYTRSPNPPVLHRKELFVPTDYPARPRFARLTAREEALGLLTSTSTIGTRLGWLSALKDRRASILGHRIIRRA